MALRDKAVEIPFKVGSCVRLEETEAIQLYKIIHKILGQIEE